ncbi:MAG: hypothetical protein HS113_04070 [Verrucomicrobiales bacterium]|nr:hypothetical protein [Verrucomicrobiales bacterium]
MKATWQLAVVSLWLAGVPATHSAELVITNDFVISGADLQYEGLDVRVESGRLTIEGTHAFAGLTLAGQARALLAGEPVRCGAVTLRDTATLVLGGGARLEVAGALVVTDAARLECLGKAADGPVNGEWRGAGVTIQAGNVALGSDARITADGQGYLSSTYRGHPGKGPGGGGQGGDYNRGGVAATAGAGRARRAFHGLGRAACGSAQMPWIRDRGRGAEGQWGAPGAARFT